MNAHQKNQYQLVDAAIEFQKYCAPLGFKIDLGQAWECTCLEDHDHRLHLAKKFSNANMRINSSCGLIHFSNDGEHGFDIAAQDQLEQEEQDVDLLENIQLAIGGQTRKILIQAVMEMRRPGGATSIVEAATAVGVSRSHFYKVVSRAREWVTRPPVPSGWVGIDCSLLTQLEFDLGGTE